MANSPIGFGVNARLLRAQPEDIPTFEVSGRGGIMLHSESARLKPPITRPGTVNVNYPRYDADWLTSGSRGGVIFETFEFESIKGETTTYDTWDFPFVVAYRALTTEFITLELSSGIEYSVALNGLASSETHYYSPDDLSEDHFGEVRELDDNVALSADAAIKLWPMRSVGFLFGLGYSHGLTQLEYSIDYRSTRNFRVYTGISILPAYPSE